MRVIDAADLTPPLRGHSVLIDAEGPQRREIIADRALEEAAHRQIAHHFLLLGEALARLGAPLHELPVGRPFEEAFLALLRAVAPAPAPKTA